MFPASESPGDLALDIVISACLGALVGFVRQWTDWAEPRREVNFGGVRTFALWSMAGCLAAAGAPVAGAYLLPAVLISAAAHQIVAMATHGHRRVGGTTFAAIMMTLLIGGAVGWGARSAAVVAAATTAIALGVKRPVHDWTKAFSRDDVYALLQFLAVTGVVLPLVPNRDFGPYGGFNPYTTWLMVVLISAVGFGGYVAMRLLGARAGILVTSLLGGIASSTATTLSFTRRSRETPELSGRCAVGVTIATAVMFVRIDVIVAVINGPLALALLMPFAIMAAPAVLVAVALWLVHRRSDPVVGVSMLENPLTLKTALKFGGLYAIIAFVVKAVRQLHWTVGLLPVSFVSGLTNMDAIALSLARGGEPSGAVLHTSAQAVIVAAIANTLFKWVVALIGGSPVLRRDVSIALGLTEIFGIIVALSM